MQQDSKARPTVPIDEREPFLFQPGAEVGGYVIERALGRGGCGQVFRAVHRATGAAVALKTVGNLAMTNVAGMRREIHALGRLDHPGIVRIREQGIHEAVPWYAMDLVEGTTLRALLSSSKDGGMSTLDEGAGGQWWTTTLDSSAPVPERAAASLSQSAVADGLSIIGALCDALAYLHGEGVVHGDLKPENVMVRHDGLPVLVDFGIVSRQAGPAGRETLELTPALAGTLAYISPERIRGETVDARADLYAIGVMLYEVLSGHLPFRSTIPGELLRLHVEENPEAPSIVVPEVPAELDELVLALLAKDPRDRIGFAEDVGRRLEEAGIGRWRPSRPLRPYLYRSSFEGRDEALRSIGARIAAMKRGSGGVLLLKGPSGIGKTRLAVAASRAADDRGVTVVTGECVAPRGEGDVGGGSLQPFAGLFAYVADRCRERGPTETQRLLGSQTAVLVPFAAELREIPGASTEPPEPLPPSASRLRVMTVLFGVLRTLAEDRPLLMVLDDLQWADEMSQQLLVHLDRVGLQEDRVLILGTLRSEEKIPAAISGLRAEEIVMGRLDETGVEGMVRSMLAMRTPPPAFVRYLDGRSEGNPFYVAEYLRLAVTEGVLRRDEGGRFELPGDRYAELPLPSSIRGLVNRHLERLDVSSMALLEAMAVRGHAASDAWMAEITGLSFGARSEGFTTLLAAGMVESPRDGEYRIAHDRFREVAYARMAAAARRRLHRRAAEIMARGGEARTASALGELAAHWERARCPARARDAYAHGGRVAVDEGLLDESRALLEASLRLTRVPTRDSIPLRGRLGSEVLGSMGRIDEGLESCRRALAEAEALGDVRTLASAWTHLGNLEAQIGLDAAARSYRRAFTLFKESGSEQGYARALSNLSKHERDPAKKRRMAREVLDIGRKLGDAGIVIVALGNLATAVAQEGDAVSAMGHCDEAISLADESRWGRMASRIAINRANLAKGQGDVASATETYEKAIAWSRKGGDVVVHENALLNLGVIHLETGRLEAARESFESALRLARDAGLAKELPTIIANLGCVDELQGDLGSARRCFAEARRGFHDTESPVGEALVFRHLGDIALTAGRTRAARDAYATALDLLTSSPDPRIEGRVRSSQARLLRVEGRPVEAEAAAREAVSCLEADRFELGCALCELGLALLADAKEATAQLRECESLVVKLGARPESRLGRAVTELRAAMPS